MNPVASSFAANKQKLIFPYRYKKYVKKTFFLHSIKIFYIIVISF